ncbi:hypothetical protein COLO4_00565, partial [Corchorus olitorius]
VDGAEVAGVWRVTIAARDARREIVVGERKVVARDDQFLLAIRPAERALQPVQRHAGVGKRAGQQQRGVVGLDAQRPLVVGEDGVAGEVLNARHGWLGMLARRHRRQRARAERHLAHRGAASEVHGRGCIGPPAGDIALPVDVQIVDAAGRLFCAQGFQHAAGQRQRGGDVAQVGQIQCRGLDLQAAQGVARVHSPPHGDIAQAARRARRVGRRLDAGACQRGDRRRLGGQVQRLPEQRVDAQGVLAARIALMGRQRLEAAQLQRVKILADLQIELLPCQACLTAREYAVRKLHRTIGRERAAFGRGQHGHVALHGRQLQRIDLPGRLAMPVVPVAGAGEQ